MTLEEIRTRLIDAMALLPEEHADWLQHAEAQLYAHRACLHRFKRMYDVSSVGGRIRTARVALGMSQEQLAIRMGPDIYQGDVSGWERGKRALPADKLRTLCAICGVSKEWVLGMSDDGGPGVPGEQLRKKVTRRWKQKRDYWDAYTKAKKEREKLNRRRTSQNQP